MSAARRDPRRSWHWTVLVVSTLVVGLSVFLDGNSEQVQIFGRTLPPLCMFKNLTGMSCPGCGLTRSFVFMGEASVIEAFSVHWMGPLLWVFVAAQVPFRLLRLFGGPPSEGAGNGAVADVS